MALGNVLHDGGGFGQHLIPVLDNRCHCRGVQGKIFWRGKIIRAAIEPFEAMYSLTLPFPS